MEIFDLDNLSYFQNQIFANSIVIIVNKCFGFIPLAVILCEIKFSKNKVKEVYKNTYFG